MKIKHLLIPILLASSLLGACHPSTPKEVEEIDTSYYFIFGNNLDTKAHFTYKNDYFRESAKKFNHGLALMSFVAAANSGQKKEMRKYYNAIHFSNVYFTSVYDTGSGEDTYGFTLASREIDDFTLLSLSFRSYDYTEEWVSNVTLGDSGNHAGFEYAVDNALIEFNEVVKSKYSGKNLKLWVNGFSRGGAEANMFATKLLNNNEFGFNQDNLYCYTFEAPAPFGIEEVKKDYKNIFNLANEGDIVVNVPPEEYGLYRSGIDINILRSDFDELYASYMRELYPEPVYDPETGKLVDMAEKYIEMIPKFSKSSKYQDEAEFMDVLIGRILATDDPKYGIQDRVHYVEHLQTAARFLTKLFFSMDQFATYYIINHFRTHFLDTPAHILHLADTLLEDDGEGIFKIAQKYLDFVEQPYVEEDLRKTCLTIYNVVTEIGFSDVFSIINALPNIQRALYFHWHESTYVLVKNLEYTPEE